MSAIYPLVEATVVAACIGVILFAAVNLAAGRGTWHALAWAAAGLAWFLVVWELARAGVFEGTRSEAAAATIGATLVSLAVGWALLASSYRTKPAPPEIIAFQAIRVVAVVVLVAFAGEALPAWLGLPIGVGDVLVGVTAIGVARGLRGGGSGSARAARAWNLAGAALALFTIVAPIASARDTGYFFSLYPLVLFPAFLAPCALVLHALALRAVKRP